jgi:hypothetical protein
MEGMGMRKMSEQSLNVAERRKAMCFWRGVQVRQGVAVVVVVVVAASLEEEGKPVEATKEREVEVSERKAVNSGRVGWAREDGQEGEGKGRNSISYGSKEDWREEMEEEIGGGGR